MGKQRQVVVDYVNDMVENRTRRNCPTAEPRLDSCPLSATKFGNRLMSITNITTLSCYHYITITASRRGMC